MRPQDFQNLLLSWFDRHGRKNLPWQHNKTPYRVWISEIMLQQTQVSTVIPYYQRFLQQFPDLKSLANAAQDDVLHLWAGLGYYSRARNLHQAAKMVMEKFAGQFPSHLEDLQALPGIGQSTAGAIAAIAFNQPATILDGNVKRVLARFHGIETPIDEKNTENELWKLATAYTPQARVADYTQAIMDLGATLCTRGQPNCAACPLQKKCSAHARGIAVLLPRKKSARKIPVKTATFLILQKSDTILLHKRPPTGIWGGLWSLPEIPGAPELNSIADYCRRNFKISATEYLEQPAFRHTFSHYHLDIHPVVIKITKMPLKIMEAEQQIWYNPAKPEPIGLPKPIQTIIRDLGSVKK